jgi:hypothetical protein
MDNLKVTDRLPDVVYVALQWCRIESIGGLVGERKNISVTKLGGGRDLVIRYASNTEDKHQILTTNYWLLIKDPVPWI